MTKKTYKTFSLTGLHLLLRDANGTRIEVVFRGGIHIDSTARYSTSDPLIQEALEKTSSFGRDFYLEEVRDNTEKAEPKAEAASSAKQKDAPALTDIKDSRRFRNLVEMRNAMLELGFTTAKGMNYMQAKAAAQKEGYDFQIQK